MTTVKQVIDLITGELLQNPGAVFGALLNLGDRRVCRLLLPLRDNLARKSVNQVVRAGTGFISAAAVEFYMDWLEDIGASNDDLYGAVASGLGLLRRYSRALEKQHYRADIVLIGERPFPCSREMTRAQFAEIFEHIPVAEYTQQIAPRFYALERAERPPRIMPHILREWDLEPRTDPSETALLPMLH